MTELANRLDQSRDGLSTPQGETSTSLLLELGDLKIKVLRLTEQNTTLEGDVSFLKHLAGHVEAIEEQILKWRFRLPEMTHDDNDEKVGLTIQINLEATRIPTPYWWGVTLCPPELNDVALAGPRPW